MYKIDLTRFEQRVKENQVKLFILSSPDNPVGRVWDKEELTGMMDICKKYGVLVISDEIHQDIIIGEKIQYPTATLGDYDEILITSQRRRKL